MLVSVALATLAVPVLAWTAYLALLALLSGRTAAPSAGSPPRTRFDVIVPAHDEEVGIAATVQSLASVDYPPSLRRIVVVADNCTDATAARATAAGAAVLERHDPSRRGKGYALAFAFDQSLREPRHADAVVVVDADTHVTPNLLRAFDARLQAGARALQAEYAVANPLASWRTRLMHIGFALFHDVRSRARERLRVSSGLRGNGMAFALDLLAQVPYDAFSVVEDIEYGIRLGLSGFRVEYAPEARVFGQMVSSAGAASSQRRRWEGGRFRLAREHVPPLLRESIRRRDRVLLDLAADLLVPPLTYVALAALAGGVASASWAASGRGSIWLLAPWTAAWAGLAGYVLRGVQLSGVGARAIVDLAWWAPVYMVWKVALAVRSMRSREEKWVRTPREGEKS
jgi:cellulose synthase/poly-beta-1,6-N-acetylglucosamine synthase-like glycosyltransferase